MKNSGGPAGDECQNLVAFSCKNQLRDAIEDRAPALRAMSPARVERPNGGGQLAFVDQDLIVRRFTPLECERLQGLPDNHTGIKWKGRPIAADGPRYRVLGNAIPVPVLQWIGRRIQFADDFLEAHNPNS